MGFDSSLRSKVKSLASQKKGSVDAEKIFASRELREYLTDLARTMTEMKHLRVSIAREGPNGDIGWTNKDEIHLNADADFFAFYEGLEARFVALMGVGFHEIAHCIFLDFNEEMKAMSFIENGNFYGEHPRNLSVDEDSDWADMIATLKDPNGRAIFSHVFGEVSNIIADRHDEDCLIREYGSFVGEPIYLARRSLQAGFNVFEDDDEKLRTGKGSDLSEAYNLLLQLTRFESIVCQDEDTVYSSRFGPMLEKVKNHARIACVTDDVMRKYEEMNYIFLALWPFIRAELQKMQNKQKNGNSSQNGNGTQNSSNGTSNQSQSSGSDSKSGDSQSSSGKDKSGSQKGNSSQSQPITAEQVKKILEQLAAGAKNAGTTKAPEKRKSSATALQNRNDERKGKTDPSKKADEAKPDEGKKGTEAIYAALDNILQEVATRMAEDELEKKAKQNLVDMVVTVNQTSSHIGVPLRLERILDVTESDIARYNMYMEELTPYSKRLQKQMLDAMKDQQDGYVAKHRPYGRTFEVTDAYRPDQKFFSNNKQPQDLPNMAIYVLVDHSGSMSGERINTSMKAAMLLYDFATKINIPVAVGGHCTGSVGGKNGVIYKVYTDFEKISGKDKYRLAKMSSSGANRDGMALNIAVGMLKKRPEQQKMLIIISDGRPSDYNYSGEEAAKDIQEIVRKAKAAGVEVLAAAIGNDKPNIQSIYGDAFFDISDLSLLPKELTRIVKKRVLANAR